MAFVSEAFGESTGRVLVISSSVADKLASVHLLELSDLGAGPFSLGRLGNSGFVGSVDEPGRIAWIIDAFAETEGAEIGLDQVGSGAGFFKLDVDVDSSVTGIEGVLELDSPDLVAIVVVVHLYDVIAWSSDLDEADGVVKAEVDEVSVVPHVSDGADGVQVDFNSDVEAILAGPRVSSTIYGQLKSSLSLNLTSWCTL